MANFIDKASISSVATAIIIALIILAIYGIKKYSAQHPSTNDIMKLVEGLANTAVAQLEKKDADGNTKLHTAIKFVLNVLSGYKFKNLPDNIEDIVIGYIEKAVLDTRYKQATIASNNEQANVLANAPTAQDLTSLPAENGEMITKGNAPSVDTDENDPQASKINTPVADTEASEDETDKPVDVPSASEDQVQQVVLTINNQKPDENGNINIELPKVEKEK